MPPNSLSKNLLNRQVTTATPERTQGRPGWAVDHQVNDALSVCMMVVTMGADERRIQPKQGRGWMVFRIAVCVPHTREWAIDGFFDLAAICFADR